MAICPLQLASKNNPTMGSDTASQIESRFINSLKTVSSRLIRKEFSSYLEKYYWKPVLWTRAYCLITAGGALIDIFKQYIQKQESPK